MLVRARKGEWKDYINKQKKDVLIEWSTARNREEQVGGCPGAKTIGERRGVDCPQKGFLLSLESRECERWLLEERVVGLFGVWSLAFDSCPLLVSQGSMVGGDELGWQMAGLFYL